LQEEIKIPEIIYLANKAENGFEGDLLADFYKMFPNADKDRDPSGNLIEPIFISAEHGDGLPDLF
jgi:predicted GTPase